MRKGDSKLDRFAARTRCRRGGRKPAQYMALDGERVQSAKGAPKAPADDPLAYPLHLYLSGAAVREPGMKEFLLHFLANAERLSTAAGLRAFAASDYQQAAARITVIR